MDENKIVFISHDIYLNFKNKIKEIFNDLSNLKISEYEINNLQYLEKENDLYYDLIFFINYKKILVLNIDSKYDKNDKNYYELLNTKIYNKENTLKQNLYRRILYMDIYLLSKIESIIAKITKIGINIFVRKNKIDKINQIRQILIQLFYEISKLYIKNIFNINQILIFFNIMIIFIKKTSIYDDKYIKVKNIIFLQLLIEDYFGTFLKLLLNNSRTHNDDIILFFNYIIKVLSIKEMYSYFEIFARNNIIQKFISVLLDNINYNKHIDIYNIFKGKIIDILANINKNNTKKSNLFEILINHNKKSFINLVNFKIRKDDIIKDIYIQNFNIELLYKIFSQEKLNEIKGIKSEKNYFIFNGINSKMTFKLNEFSFNNSILFFTFELSKDNLISIQNESIILTLIHFQSDSKNETLFKLYIKKDKDINLLYINQEKKENKKDKNKTICLDKLGNIQVNIQYFIAIRFSYKKIQVFLSKSGEKSYEENEIYDLDNKDSISPILRIGHDEKNKEYFKGYIGSFIAIKDLSIKKHCNIEQIFNNIFNLKNLYIYFPFFFSKSSIYSFGEKIIFSSIKEENEFNDIKIYLQNNIENFQCSIYLTPEILKIYHQLYFQNENIKIYDLPKIRDINLIQKHKILDMNISLVGFNNINIDFFRNNGLDYFTLIYEYYFLLYKLIAFNKEEFEIYLINNNNIENIIIKTINSILIILYNDFTYYKYIILYPKKYKTLFRNIHEVIKSKNNKIFNGVYIELFKLYFKFLKELNELRNEINIHPENKQLLEAEKIMMPFSYGLIEMLFDIDLYINNQEEPIIILLFEFTKNSMIDYKSYQIPNKTIFPFWNEFFDKIMNFIKVIENKFPKNIIRKTVIEMFFNLVTTYLEIIDNEQIKHNYFNRLFIFILENYKNNFNLIKNYLYFTYEMLWKNFYLGSEGIEVLLNIYNKQKDKTKNNIINNIINNNEQTEDLNSLIFIILIKLLFMVISNKVLQGIISKLELLITSESLFSKVMLEFTKNFEKILSYKIINKKESEIKSDFKENYMKLFRNIFKCFFSIYELIINKNPNKLPNLLHVFDNLSKTLNNKLDNNKKNIYCLYCLVNFLKFYYRVIFTERKISINSDIKFTENLIDVIELCNKCYLTRCIYLFKIKMKNIHYQKTILEMIYDILIQYFLNDRNSENCYNILLEKYKSTFFDKKLINNEINSIFYTNDLLYLLYNLNKKKIKKNDFVKNMFEMLNYYDELFINEDSFNGNFIIYFLPIISTSFKRINLKKTFKSSPISKLSNFLNDLLSYSINEINDLYKINKKYFFRTNTNKYYNETMNFIRDNIIKKKPNIEEIKKKLDFISEKWNYEFLNKINNIKEKIQKKGIHFESETIQKEEKKINNHIKFFYDLDKYYAVNIKKEIMNCIFSIYYLDELFYSNDFCIIKKYYMNKYLDNSNNNEYIKSKKLKFPSIIKNYRNNFENSLFIKKYNNFIINPYFKITHSFIKDESLKNNLIFQKSIKLYQKEFHYYENDIQIECEIIKNESIFYGKLYFNESKNYLLFKEEKINFKEEEGYNHIFLISYLLANKSNNTNQEIAIENKCYKNILFLFDNIEEIIEIRILLLWKGFEIYLKNGKSYIFNFLTTKEYNDFMEIYLYKSKIKNLIRKRNFFTKSNNIIKMWKKGLLCNYEYILILNRYSSRSFNDPTQYPIFPWLLKNYEDLEFVNKNEKNILKIQNEYYKIQKEEKDYIQILSFNRKNQKDIINFIKLLIKEEPNNNSNSNIQKSIDYKEYIKEGKRRIESLLRNFNYTPTFQTNDSRERAKLEYETEEKNNSKFPIHTNSHYSNVGYIYFYLMRQQPYDNLLVKMQGNALEAPNRCFSSIISLQKTIYSGNDNRELIPEFFSKIEFFLNLNCDFYGKQELNNNLIDDCEIKNIINNDNKNIYLSKFVCFIIQHKYLLNSKIIGIYLKKWIDKIFGPEQLPKNNRKESYNIFPKFSYEQLTNLEEKLEKKLKNNNLTKTEIKMKLTTKIEYISNFGVTPSIIFYEPHPKLDWVKIYENKIEKDKKKLIKDQTSDFESILEDIITPNALFSIIKGNPIFFKINPSINKIFIYNNEDNMVILDCQLYNEINYQYFYYNNYNVIKNINILYTKENSEYQVNYSFCSFDNLINYYNNNEIDNYHTYYYNRINFLLNNDKIINNFKTYNFFYIKIITCRHIDCSFKIHYLREQNNSKKKENQNKIYSYICEDFVTACCCVSNNAFIIGLNNGKLIYYIIKENSISNISISGIEQKYNIQLEKKMYIQAHYGQINAIEIDKRLGLVITSGSDNYIFIRKLYDFELLLPIKIKKKYRVLMMKISSYNFLYVLCINIKINKKVFFGYTLSGMKFAKSNYGLYDNINFTIKGNIITLNNKKDIIILSGSDLTELNISDNKQITNISKKIKYMNWLQFNYFLRGQDDKFNEVLTFLDNRKGENYIRTLNLSN